MSDRIIVRDRPAPDADPAARLDLAVDRPLVWGIGIRAVPAAVVIEAAKPTSGP